MSWFAPPRPPGKRYKILLWGESGSLKTLSALGFPNCAYIDNHGSAENYQAAYPQHVFFPPPGILTTFDNQRAAVTELLGAPGNQLTCVIDDMTTVWEQIQTKWAKLFLTRLPKSKGYHAEFYTFQPSDWVHPKRENRSFVRTLLALDMNVIVIARAKKEYAGASGDSDFMKVVGSIFAGEPNLIYEFDYAFKLSKTPEGKFEAEVSQKQRVPVGGKPFPDKIEFGVDAQGKSTFFQVFCQYANVAHFNTPAHAVQLPAESFPAEDSMPGETGCVSEPISGPQPASLPDHPAPPAGSAVQAPPSTSVAMSEAQASQPSTTQPQPPLTCGEGDGKKPIAKEQLDVLVDLKAGYKIEKQEWDATLMKFYNVATAKALTYDQAEHFTNYLKTQRVPF